MLGWMPRRDEPVDQAQQDQRIEQLEKQLAMTQQELGSMRDSAQDQMVKGLMDRLAERDREVLHLRTELESRGSMTARSYGGGSAGSQSRCSQSQSREALGDAWPDTVAWAMSADPTCRSQSRRTTGSHQGDSSLQCSAREEVARQEDEGQRREELELRIQSPRTEVNRLPVDSSTQPRAGGSSSPATVGSPRRIVGSRSAHGSAHSLHLSDASMFTPRSVDEPLARLVAAAAVADAGGADDAAGAAGRNGRRRSPRHGKSLSPRGLAERKGKVPPFPEEASQHREIENEKLSRPSATASDSLPITEEQSLLAAQLLAPFAALSGGVGGSGPSWRPPAAGDPTSDASSATTVDIHTEDMSPRGAAGLQEDLSPGGSAELEENSDVIATCGSGNLEVDDRGLPQTGGSPVSSSLFANATDNSGAKESRRHRFERHNRERGGRRRGSNGGGDGNSAASGPKSAVSDPADAARLCAAALATAFTASSAIDRPGQCLMATPEVVDADTVSPARVVRREFAPPIRAAAANAVAIASAAANVAMAVVAKQEQCQRFLPHRQRALAQNMPTAGSSDRTEVQRPHFMQAAPPPSITASRQGRSPRTSPPRASPRGPRVGGSGHSPSRLSPRAAQNEEPPPRALPLSSGAAVSSGAAPRTQPPSSGSGAPATYNPSSLRSKLSELRDEMKRRRASPAAERDRERNGRRGSRGNRSIEEELASPLLPLPVPPLPGMDAQDQAARPSAERGSAAATAREMVRREDDQGLEFTQHRAYPVQSSRTGQSKSPRPDEKKGGSSGCIRGRASRSGNDGGHQGGRVSPGPPSGPSASAPSGERLWRCPSARRVTGNAPSAGGKRPVPPISGLLQLRACAAAASSPPRQRAGVGPTAQGSGGSLLASAAGSAVEALVSKVELDPVLSPRQQTLPSVETAEPVVVVEEPIKAALTTSDRPSLSSVLRRAATVQGRGAGGGSAVPLTASASSIPAATEVHQGGFGSVSLSISGSASYSTGGCSLNLAAASSPSARERQKSPIVADKAQVLVMPSSITSSKMVAATTTAHSPPYPQPLLSAVAAAATGMSPQPSPRVSLPIASGGLGSPRSPHVSLEDDDLLHQAVLQFSHQRSAGRMPLVRTSPGVYMYGNKKLILMLRNGRVMARAGGGLVTLTESLLNNSALGVLGAGGLVMPEASGSATYVLGGGNIASTGGHFSARPVLEARGLQPGLLAAGPARGGQTMIAQATQVRVFQSLSRGTV